MNKTVILPERKVPVKGYWDVIVCGGGVAGIAAALSAKRAGAGRVLLLEREFALGGLAALGLVTIFLPLCDGRGTQVSFGIAQELMRLSVSRGAEDPIPECWTKESTRTERAAHRLACRFNAPVFSCLAEELLRDSSVDILYGAQVCGAAVSSDRVNALVYAGRAGDMAACEAGGFVDASGDAAVFRFAGAETVDYALGNRQASWYYSNEGGRSVLHTLGLAPAPGERMEGGFTGLETQELSTVMLKTHRQIADHYFSDGNYNDGHALTMLPSIPQVRMSRRISGLATMRLSDDGKACPDSVGMISNWREAGPVYEMPLGALRGGLTNLFAAGRIISSDDAMWDITRAIPCCAVSGEAAGIAAYVGPSSDRIQNEFERRGVTYHAEQLRLAGQ